MKCPACGHTVVGWDPADSFDKDDLRCYGCGLSVKSDAWGELENLRSENEALRADAERYQAIRSANVIQLRTIERWLYETPEELDAAIDALRGKGE